MIKRPWRSIVRSETVSMPSRFASRPCVEAAAAAERRRDGTDIVNQTWNPFGSESCRSCPWNSRPWVIYIFPWGEPTAAGSAWSRPQPHRVFPWGEPTEVWGEPARLVVIPWGEPAVQLVGINYSSTSSVG